MSISQNFPNTRPSLSINFARSQTLDPRITFTRTTSGTRVGPDGYIEVIPADQQRFDFDPVTGECLGLLIEGQRENLITYSEDFTNSIWDAPFTGRSRATIVTRTGVDDPSGGTTAATFKNGGSLSDELIWRIATGTANVPYTMSVWIRRRSGTGQIDLVVGDNIAVEITNQVTNQWKRISLTATPTTTTVRAYILIKGLNDEIDIWGYQLESNKDASSYIPTLGSTVTRTSDNAFIDGENFSRFFNPNEGTAVITYRPRFNGVYNSPFRPLYSIRNPSGTIMGFAGNSNDSQLYFHSYVALLNGGNFTWLVPPSPSTERSERALVSYANTYFRMYQNEIAFVSTNTLYGAGKISDYIPSSVGISTLGFNALVFGCSSASNESTKFNHIIQQFVYYPSEVGISNAKTLSKRP